MILDRFRLDDQVAVVTGAGRGLGAAMALAFAEAGADVVIASRTQSQLEEVADQIKGVGRRAHIVTADLAHPEDTAKLAGTAIEAFGKLDIVVNNVGGTMPNTLLTTSTKDLKDAFTFNVATAHALTTAAVPLMLEHSGGGSIINITSTMGRLSARGFAAYGTAKAALAHYTRLSALDLCPRIRVNAIAPGSILTSALDVVASNDELREPMEKVTPMRRLGDPLDIAAAAVYLASPAGSFLTGKTLVSAVRRAVDEVDPNLAIAQVRMLQDIVDRASDQTSFTMVLLAIAATVALLLGAIGIYGVISYIVAQRTGEIGVRLALGAQPQTVARMILRQGGLVTMLGIVAGLGAALAGSQLIRTLLYGVSPRDPIVFSLTTVALLVVALLACWLPARRASRLSPLEALRTE